MPTPCKFTVLVIDPSPSNQQLICDCLDPLPDVLTLALDSGQEALKFYEDYPPSLLLVDISLPDMDGITLARKIRSREQLGNDQLLTPWTPIIFLSSVMDENLLAKGILAGGDDFLHKPVSEVILLAKVRALLRIVGMQRDIHAAHRKLREISTLDGLTGIPNRRHFDDTLAIEWKRCLRSNSPLSLLLGDVDFFKQYNDTYGHPAGDTCLRAVAHALNESLFRVEDTVCRYGGEEFVAVLPGTDRDGALAVAERMRQALKELQMPHENGINGRVSCSFGLACLHPTVDLSMQSILHLADEKLYQAKRQGRNCVAH
ncbi:MAG: diguanylate cyclase [Dechloromonas sp.]|nr:diguanylate cyclase [Dechloromonas sp.]